MKKIVSMLFIIFVTLSMVMSVAHAKRFGGGRSFGAYRAPSSFSRSMPSSSPRMSNPLQNRNSWLGPLAGLAMGGLLASLFMGNGLASGMMSWLLVAGVIFLMINLLRSFSRNKMSTSPSAPIYQMQREQPASAHQPFAANFTSSKPAGFDENEFLRIAKVQFMRLQAAFDKKNVTDIHQFTTPEVFAEIKMQLQERGDQANQTDVVTLNAKLLDVATERQGIIASVEFSGMIKEDINQPAAAFNEIWHFEQGSNGQWLMAGLQQG